MKGSLLLLAISAFTGCLSSSETEPTPVSVSLGSKVSLKCDHEDIEWTLTNNNGTTETIQEEEESYEIVEGRLSISNIQESQLGTYTCQSGDTVIRAFQLDTSLKINKFPKSISVNDGLPQELLCTLNSHDDQEVVFNWFRADEGDSEGSSREMLCSLEGSSCPALEALKSANEAPADFKERAKIEVGMNDDIPFSKLIIQKSHVTDRKIYICQAKLKNADPIDDCEASKECDESEVILRVKDPLAALWPFVGIVAEVIILCIIIFFCEKNKSEDKEDYDEVAGNGSTVTSSNINIRQRK